MNKLIKKYLKSDDDFIYLRHELLEKGFKLSEAIIVEFMFKHSKLDGVFPYPISAIKNATGISRTKIYQFLNMLFQHGFLIREDNRYKFTDSFIEMHEDICLNVKFGKKSYNIIYFGLKDELGLTFQEYALLDSFRHLSSKGLLRYHPLHFSNVFNIDIAYYYNLRNILSSKQLIEIKTLNFLSLTPQVKIKFNDLINKCTNFSEYQDM